MRSTISAVVLLILAPAIGLPQAPTDSWNNLKLLRVGNNIEVVNAHSERVKGQFLGVSEGFLSLRVNKQSLNIPRDEVVVVSRPTSRVKQLLMGVLAGAVIAANAWVKADRHARGCYGDDDFEWSCDPNRKGLSRRSLAIGTGVGAGALGIAAAFMKVPGQLMYARDPNGTPDAAVPDSSPEAQVVDELPLALRQTPALEVLEGGNVFAPMSLTEKEESGESKSAGGPK